jgi:hypothetical protein
MKPVQVTVKKPNGAIDYIRFEVDKQTDLVPFKKFAAETSEIFDFKITEGDTINKLWYYSK